MSGRLVAVLQDADVAFKKVDSLLRGHPAAEIAGCVRLFDHCIIAPAFPYRERVTCQGRQMARVGENWRDVGVELQADLRRLGVTVSLCRPGDAVPAGTSLWDSESEADLLAVVSAGTTLRGRVLWCGSGGLAGALVSGVALPPPPLPRPVLALIGSDHPTTTAQLSAAWAHVHRISRGDPEEAAPVARRLGNASAAAVAVTLSPGVHRDEARRRIERCFAVLLRQLEAPGSLLVSGGETLRTVCDVLEVKYLELEGEIMPGVSVSLLRGGRWDGVCLIAKSGAAGDAGLLLQILGDRP